VFLLQHQGGGLGKTGWIHRTGLKNKKVQMLNSVEYLKIDDEGLHIRIGETGEPQVLPVDNIVICAGQDPLRELLTAAAQSVIYWRAMWTGDAAAIDQGRWRRGWRGWFCWVVLRAS
jgi:hypothetical protein